MVRLAGVLVTPLGSQNSAARGSMPAPALAGHQPIRQCSRLRVPGHIATRMMMLQVLLLVRGRIMRSPSALPCQGKILRRVL